MDETTTILKCDTLMPITIATLYGQKRDRNGEINKKAISDYILQHFFSLPKIDLGYLMLPLNNILTFIHKVSLLNYWGRKRDLDFLFGCFCPGVYGGMHITQYLTTRYAPRSLYFLPLSLSCASMHVSFPHMG